MCIRDSFFVGVCINAVLPRVTVRQGLKYLWKWPTIVALAGLLIVVLTQG